MAAAVDGSRRCVASEQPPPPSTLEFTVVFFARDFATTFLAAMLLSSGVAHVSNFSAFRAALDTHGFVPTSARTLVALAVMVTEISFGSLTLVASWSRSDALAAIVFGGGALAGAGFLLYVRKLLRSRVPASTCGCSPLTSPVTQASLVPAASLTLVSGVGLGAVWLGSIVPPGSVAERPEMFGEGIVSTLPVAWGLTLAGIVWLFPAAAPPTRLEEP
jgi:hypothetical protein